MVHKDNQDYEYDVCLSFAGEDRKYVRQVADELRRLGIRVFYDEYQEVDLWGKDLYEHLDDIYKNAARYCVIFVSNNYASKLWTNHERKSAQERAFKDSSDYILPARFDDTIVPGLRETVGYIDLCDRDAINFAKLIQKKVGGHFRKNYIPPIPDKLITLLEVEDSDEIDELNFIAHNFLSALKRTTEEERELIAHFFLNACPAELPDNVHVNIDLLRRVFGGTEQKIKRMLGNLSSLGFIVSLREDNETDGHLGKQEMLVLEWNDMSVGEDIDVVKYCTGTGVANAMINAAFDCYCEGCALDAFKRLDFSQLSEITADIDVHDHGEEKSTLR